jgi:protein-disulfide isomerase-like protein with CxxC motif
MTTEAQREKAKREEVIRNDQRVREQQGSTFLEHTHNDEGGRCLVHCGP